MAARRLHVLIAASVLASAVLVGVGRAGVGSAERAVQEGGIFTISMNSFSGLDYMDPALASSPPGWALLDTTCARLLSYPAKGFRLRPEVAASYPTVSADRKTYTFRLRSGFRFSDGSRVQ